MRRLMLLVALSSVSANALADSPYVVLRDDGTIEDNPYRTGSDVSHVASALLDAYAETGKPLPDVMSVWSAFPLAGQSLFTLYLPLGNDVAGIGLDEVYGGDGTFRTPVPPLFAILLHNDVTDLPARAARHDAPVDGYARYLFLLELSHAWGPALRLPGDDPDALIGFPFHWSFWMDAGGSPSGGNVWIDGGDGSFSTAPATPGELRYSLLDLYLQGLAEASEVPPFGVLVDAEPPRGAGDPINGGGISAVTFPWFGAEPLTVQATRRELTIEDVIAANGARDPAFGEAPPALSLGIVLVVRADTSDEELAALRAIFDPIASSLAPAYEDATSGRGHLDVVTADAAPEPEPEPDAGLPAPDAGSADPDAGTPVTDDPDSGVEPAERSAGCAAAGGRGRGPAPLAAGLAFALVPLVRSRGRRARR